MLKKFKENLDVTNKKIILILFLIALIYFIIYTINYLISNNKVNNTVKNKEIDYTNISSYINDENIVRDYNMYSSLNDATKNFLSYLQNSNYDLTYSIMDNEIKNKYDKNNYINKISAFSNKLFSMKNNTDEPSSINDIVIAYKIDNNNYICSYDDQNNNLYNIGIRIYPNNKYKIFYLDI